MLRPTKEEIKLELINVCKDIRQNKKPSYDELQTQIGKTIQLAKHWRTLSVDDQEELIKFKETV